MLVGRFAFVVPVMALAGSFVRKKVVPAGAGTFPITGPLFVSLLIGVILIVGALTYFPAYSLGPIVEHLHLTGKIMLFHHSLLDKILLRFEIAANLIAGQICSHKAQPIAGRVSIPIGDNINDLTIL